MNNQNEINELAHQMAPLYNAALEDPEVEAVTRQLQQIFEDHKFSGVQAAAATFPLIAYAVDMITPDLESKTAFMQALGRILAATRVELSECCLRQTQGDKQGHSLDCITQRVKEEPRGNTHE